MHILEGLGLKEELWGYDHPFFGPLFLASTLFILGYPSIVIPDLSNKDSFRSLYLVPRLIMGILAVIDTYLVYKIGEIRYGKKVALIAALLFAVMPFTWFPERYMREPLRTGNVLMIVDKQLKHDVLDYSLNGSYLDEIRKTYFGSDRIGLFFDTPVTGYNLSQYPYTNMKENSGFGLIEVRSNFNDRNLAYAQVSDNTSLEALNTSSPKSKMPHLLDQGLRVELVASGLKFPTAMAFVGNNDILVVEKNTGTIQRVVNGNLLEKSVLDLNVANKIERGLLGIAVANQTLGNDTVNKTYVYLFYT